MALDETTAMIESKVGKQLKKFLKKNVLDVGLTEELAVIDKNLGSAIKEKLGIPLGDSMRRGKLGCRPSIYGAVAPLDGEVN